MLMLQHSVDQRLAVAGEGIIENNEHICLEMHYSPSETLSFKDV